MLRERKELATVIFLILPITLTGFVGGAEFMQLAPMGQLPEPRAGHSVAYDPTNNRMMVFAGVNPSGCLSDTWVLTDANGIGSPAWVKLAPEGTLPRGGYSSSAVYDHTSNRLIVFAGDTGCTGSVDESVFVLTNANGLGGTPVWIKLAPPGVTPSERRSLNTQVAYDPGSNRLILFGGCQCYWSGDSLNDVWVLSNANGLGGTPEWTRVLDYDAPGSPAPRPDGAGLYDPNTNVMTLFGGGRTDGGFFNDLWLMADADGLSGSPTWTPLQTSAPPPPRSKSVIGFDGDTNRLIVFGGFWGDPTGSTYTFYNDLWVLPRTNDAAEPATWLAVPVAGVPPIPRATQGFFDKSSKRMIFFGGNTVQDGVSAFFNDLWVVTEATGAPIDTTPPALILPADLTAEATSAGGATVSFSASAHDDFDGDVPVSCQPASGSVFPLGTTTVACSAVDGAGNTGAGSFVVTVRDTTPPVFAGVRANPASLWPPNHKMRDLVITGAVWDAVDLAPSFRIIGVSSNEGSNADWNVTGDLTLQLRAERNGNGDGRVYTITLEAGDAAGNVRQTIVSVVIPHNQ